MILGLEMDTSYIDLSIIATTHQYVVYEAARIKDQHIFAKKQLKREAESLGSERFRNEARLLARLDHPNIIRVIDQQLSYFPLYVITPRYQENLREWLCKNTGDRETDVQDIYERLLDAVAYAHEQGVIHRDLKPENILLNSPRDVVLIDFNISVSPEDKTNRLTRPGEALGTAHYLAPEQLRDSASIDLRADIYSLGIILYEIYGGRVGSSTLDVNDLPISVRGIVQRCTQADRFKRYSSVQELKRAWHLALGFNTKQSEVNELESFMLQAYENDSARAERVLNLLEDYSTDPDRIDRFFMEADMDAIGILAAKSVSKLESLLSHWIRFFSEKNWPFSYTDEIARRIELLWAQIDSSSIRAEFVVALIVLGNNHNRFFVWRIAATLIERSGDPADASSLVQQLTIFDKDELSNVSEYLVRSRLNPLVRQLFTMDRTDRLLNQGG